MGILNKIKGFIKLSEVASDNAQTLLDTATNQDVNTVITQVVNALEDSLRKQSLVVTSTGNIRWALNKITPDVGADIVVKLLQNSNGQVINLVLNSDDFRDGVSLPNNGDVFYLELNRSLITTGTISIYNGTANVGRRAIVGSGLPALVNNQSGGLQGTICIPLAVRQGANIWWSQSNYYWADGTSGFLGSVGTSAPTPTGTVIMYAGIVAPAGYLDCQGGLVNRSTYPALYSVVGDMYGTNDGFSNFRLPDFSGRVPIGAGAGIGLTPRALAATVGVETHLLTSVESGQKAVTTVISSGLVKGTNSNEDDGGDGRFVVGNNDDETHADINWNHTHSIAGSSATNAHNNMQPSLAVNYIIKV